MGNGEFKITANGIKLMLTIILICGVLIGAVKAYTVFTETTKLNAIRYEKIEPRVNKNEKDIIKIDGKLTSIDKRQERIDKKIDILLERIPR